MSSQIDFPPHVPACICDAVNTRVSVVRQSKEATKEWEERDNFLIALVSDDRMSEVFEILDAEGLADKETLSFVIVTWSSWDDFSYRDLRRRALELCQDICEQSRKLQRSIRLLRDTGAYLPPELWHPNNLEIPTGGCTPAETNLHASRAIRMAEELGLTQLPPPEGKLGPEYPPDIVPLLEAVADVAGQATKDSLFIHVRDKALTRQENLKMDYLRSVIMGLKQQRIHMNETLQRAIAITATVALSIGASDPDIDVTDQDVSRALKQVEKLD